MKNHIGPNPNAIYPIKDYDKCIFLKNFVKANNVFIGDYTYFDDRRNGPEKLACIIIHLMTLTIRAYRKGIS